MKGRVISNLLNIRAQASKEADVLGQLSKDDQVELLGLKDGWYEISYNNSPAFLFAEFIEVAKTFIFQDPELINVAVEPAKKLDVLGNPYQKKVISIYNQYGNLVVNLSKKLGIDNAVAIAVIAKESGGVSMNNGKLVIRFENHVFYTYWGKFNEATYNQHFKFDPVVKWQKHQFRKDPNTNWIDCHRSQDSEYDVLNYARSLDNEKALMSISMGLVQIMGSNSKAIGYNTAQEMFDKFSADIKYQIFGFFDFIVSASPTAIGYLKSKDYVNFAKQYNGGGQPDVYGSDLQKYIAAFPSGIV
jgi:hypothetical protein